MSKVLIIKPSSFGDIIHALPVASAISQQVPDAIIDWVVRPEYAALLEGHPSIRKVFIFDREKWSQPAKIFTTLSEIMRLIRTLSRERYDTVLDLQGLFRSGILTYLSGASNRMGFENARELAPFFYNRKVQVPTSQMHAIERYQLFVIEMGLNSSELDYGIKVPEKVVQNLERLLSEEKVQDDRPLIVLNPNARWETKRWFPDLFANLADRLIEELGVEIIIIGGVSEAEEAHRIQAKAKRSLHNMTGKTSLMHLAALLERASLMVTCDSGPMQLAAAMGTPVVALFGPTDPVRTGPFGSDHRVLKKSIDCVPCLRRSCPEGVRLCMESISVDDVLHEAKQLLADNHKN